MAYVGGTGACGAKFFCEGGAAITYYSTYIAQSALPRRPRSRDTVFLVALFFGPVLYNLIFL